MVTPIDIRWLDLPIFKPIPTGQKWFEILLRAICFGIMGVIVFFPLTILLIFAATGKNGMTAKWTFIVFKGYWGGLVGMIVAPILGFIDIAQAVPDRV